MTGPAVCTIPVAGAATTALLMAHHGGARFEAPGEAGFAHFLEHLVLRRGRGARSAADGTRALELLGADVGAETTHDLVTFHVRCRARDARATLAEFASLLARPLSAEQGVARERDVVLSELAEHSARTGFPADLAAGRAAFGRHPLGRSVLGDPSRFTAADLPLLAAFRARWWDCSRTAVIAAGATGGLPSADAIGDLFAASVPPAAAPSPEIVAPLLSGGTTSIRGGPGPRQVRVVFLAVASRMPLRLRCAMAVLDRMLSGERGGLLRLLAGRRSGGSWVAVDSTSAAHADCLTMRVSAAGPKLDSLGLGQDATSVVESLPAVPDLPARVARARLGTLGQMTLGIDAPLPAAHLAASRVLLFEEEPHPGQLLDEIARVSLDDVVEVAARLTEQPPCVLTVGPPVRAQAS